MIIYIIYYLLSPIILLILYVVSIFNFKLRDHLHHQNSSLQSALKIIRSTKRNKQLVLFHAASAGEFEQLKPILKKMDRNRFILLQSFFSPTIYNKQKNSNLFDACCYLPFDLPWKADRFLKFLAPDYLIITRHDIWPHHLHYAQKYGIKIFLINANIHQNSIWFKPGLKSFSHQLFARFDKILTGSKRLQEYTSKLANPNRVFVTGDSRIDQVIERKEQYMGNQLPQNIAKTKNVILGSIVQSDFKIVFGGLKKYYPLGDKSLRQKKQRLIIVPHETDEKTLQVIEDILTAQKFFVQRFSKIANSIENYSILIDKVGILADLYAHAELAYIGAGFGRGVHSVIEPAVHECVVSFGPNIHILDEAITMHKRGIGKMIKNESDFSEFLKLLDEKEKLSSLQKAALQFVYEQQSASKRIIEEIFGSETHD